MFIRSIKSVAATLALAAAVGSVQASPVTFDLTYSGSSFGNAAVATGFITLDSSDFTTVTSDGNVPPASLGITDFQITIANASSGNGTFGLSDFAAAPNGWVLEVSQPLDLALDLVGQTGFNDFNWCASTSACGNAKAPGGVAPFDISTSGETGDVLALKSMVVATVAEPESLALVGLALVALALARRRKSEQTGPAA
jgi:hypothetical protein